eukprot:TRINITY_DN32275_c0_g1_i2.p1 TRINITY_DN32275_c0_g1~~TRINITY_DN32275_c0_g1_i2.p1  ORF type:complete len:2670 (+),score=690.86 TRINITY_DN32275_c0_g1_i2:91-8010(+)
MAAAPQRGGLSDPLLRARAFSTTSAASGLFSTYDAKAPHTARFLLPDRAVTIGGLNVPRAPRGLEGDCWDPELSTDGAESGAGEETSPLTPRTRARRHYARRALRCLSHEHWLRAACIDVIVHPWFDRAILAVIVINATFIATDDPLATGKPTAFDAARDLVDDVCLGVFVLEAFLKVIAMGLFSHHSAYFRSMWNVLDFVIVVAGVLNLVLEAGTGVFILLRVIRIFRPLRTISRVSGMRKLVNTIMHSLPLLGNVALLCVMLFLVFGLVGVILWSQTLHRRCRMTDPDTGQLVYDTVCGGTLGFETGCREGYTCEQSAPNSNTWANWDHLGSAVLVVWQCMTLDDYVTHMYDAQDGSSPFVALYFVALTLVGAFFVLNLVLAVVTDSFHKYEDQEDQDRATRARLEFFEKKAESDSRAQQEYIARQDGGRAGLDGGASPPGERSASLGEIAVTPRQEALAEHDPDSWNATAKSLPVLSISSAADLSQRMPTATSTARGMPSLHSQRGRPGELGVPTGGADRDSLAPPDSPSGVDRMASVHEWLAQQQTEGLALDSTVSSGKHLPRCTASTNRSRHAGPLRLLVLQDDPLDPSRDRKRTVISDQPVIIEVPNSPGSLRSARAPAFGEDSGLFGRWRLHARLLVGHDYFANTISALIVLNAILMSLEHYHMPAWLVAALENANVVFVGVFTFEWLVKVFALGCREWAADRFNVFDALIVVVSLFELTFLTSATATVFRGMRLVRVVRVVKLARRWRILNHILSTVGQCIGYMGYLLLLLTLFVFVCAILGRQLFAGKVPHCCTNAERSSGRYLCIDGADEYSLDDPCWRSPPMRAHFDNLYWSCIVVLQVVTQDYWSSVMYKTMSSCGAVSALYFFAVIFLGRYLLLNLFVAILLVGLERDTLPEDTTSQGGAETVPELMKEIDLELDGDESDAELEYIPAQKEKERLRREEERKRKERQERRIRDLCGPGEEEPGAGAPAESSPRLGVSTEGWTFGAPSPAAEPADLLRNSVFSSTNLSPHSGVTSGLSAGSPTSWSPTKLRRYRMRSQSLFHELEQEPEDKIRDAPDLEDLEDGEDPAVSVSGGRPPSLPDSTCVSSTAGGRLRLNSTAKSKGSQLSTMRKDGVATVPSLTRQRTGSRKQSMPAAGAVSCQRERSGAVWPLVAGLSAGGPKSPALGAAVGGRSRKFSTICLSTSQKGGAEQEVTFSRELRGLRCPWGTPTLREWRAVIPVGDREFEEVLVGYSWGCIAPDNPVRVFLWHVVGGRYFPFETTISWLIFLSCATLIFNANLVGEQAMAVMEVLDIFFTFVFLLEILVRGTVYTFNGKTNAKHNTGGTTRTRLLSAYMQRARLNWLDMGIVAASVLALPFRVSHGAGAKAAGQVYNTARALRAWRPLRILVRSKNMKIVISAIIGTIPAVFNVMAVAIFAYFMFGVAGVQLLRGALMGCIDGSNKTITECDPADYFPQPSVPPQSLWYNDSYDLVANSTYVPLVRYRWVNQYDFSFNHIGATLVALLQCAIFNGWTDVMYAVVDSATEEDGRTVRNRQEGLAIVIILWIFVGGLGIMNVFVGCVVDYFNSIKTRLDRSALLTRGQMQTLRIKKILRHQKAKHRLVPRLTEDGKIPGPCESFAGFCFWVADSPIFSPFIILCIVLNIFVMATTHYEQGSEWGSFQRMSNISFTIIFTVEMVLKIGVAKLRGYLATLWNRLDCMIVICSWAEIMIAEFITKGNPGSVVQLLRIGRIMRLVRHLKGLKKLLLTLYYSLPALFNIGSLMALVFFIFGVMAVVFFEGVRRVPHSGGTNSAYYTEHMNFENFPWAVVSLYRVACFDNWRRVVSVSCMRPPYCSEHLPDGSSNCGASGPLDAWLTTAFFVGFVLIVGFVMMNLFIAVVLENFRENVLLPPELLAKMELIKLFREKWSYYDPRAVQVIKARDFVPLMRLLPSPMGFEELDMTTEILPSLLHLDFPVTRDNTVLFIDAIDAIGETVFRIRLSDRKATEQHLRGAKEQRARQKRDKTVYFTEQYSGRRGEAREGDVFDAQYTIADWYAACIIQAAWTRWANCPGKPRPRGSEAWVHRERAYPIIAQGRQVVLDCPHYPARARQRPGESVPTLPCGCRRPQPQALQLNSTWHLLLPTGWAPVRGFRRCAVSLMEDVFEESYKEFPRGRPRWSSQPGPRSRAGSAIRRRASHAATLLADSFLGRTSPRQVRPRPPTEVLTPVTPPRALVQQQHGQSFRQAVTEAVTRCRSGGLQTPTAVQRRTQSNGGAAQQGQGGIRWVPLSFQSSQPEDAVVSPRSGGPSSPGSSGSSGPPRMCTMEKILSEVRQTIVPRERRPSQRRQSQRHTIERVDSEDDALGSRECTDARRTLKLGDPDALAAAARAAAAEDPAPHPGVGRTLSYRRRASVRQRDKAKAQPRGLPGDAPTFPPLRSPEHSGTSSTPNALPSSAGSGGLPPAKLRSTLSLLSAGSGSAGDAQESSGTAARRPLGPQPTPTGLQPLQCPPRGALVGEGAGRPPPLGPSALPNPRPISSPTSTMSGSHSLLRSPPLGPGQSPQRSAAAASLLSRVPPALQAAAFTEQSPLVPPTGPGELPVPRRPIGAQGSRETVRRIASGGEPPRQPLRPPRAATTVGRPGGPPRAPG